MTVITRDDGFSWMQRCDEARFESLLAKSPAAEDDGAHKAWIAILLEHVDPLFCLAIFERESNMATNPLSVNVRYENHNPGNLRNPPPDASSIQTDRGYFLTFDTWPEGFAAMAIHLDSPRYHGLTIADAIHKWAPASDGNDPEAYIAGVLDFMNAHAGEEGTPTMGKRIIVSAGHENIASITADMIGQPSADVLRRATGANGEVEFNIAWAGALVQELTKRGYQAVRTDARFHPEVYDAPADMVIAGHYDGSSGRGQPQHAMGCAVLSGTESDDADKRARSFADVWWTLYSERTGYAQGPITNDMSYYYGGWYRSAVTPMVILEHCLGADADGRRTDHISPQEAAVFDADALDAFYGAEVPPTVFVQPGNPYGPIEIKPPIWNRFNLLESVKPKLGYAMMGYAIAPEDADRVQRFERGRYQATDQEDPWNVVQLFDMSGQATSPAPGTVPFGTIVSDAPSAQTPTA